MNIYKKKFKESMFRKNLMILKTNRKLIKLKLKMRKRFYRKIFKKMSFFKKR